MFSLGNDFLSVPLDRAIAPDILLQPLQPNPAASIGDVIHNLATQDSHPPLYFVLAHLWMKLFPSEGGLVSLFAARSLPAIFGAASIPCVYVLSKVAFRSRLVGHLSAATIAVSPYAVFLAQEARHYTLAILWVIGSLTCLVIATRHIQNRTPLPIWVALSWVAINALGIATHYFFTFTLYTEAVVLISLAWLQLQTSTKFSLLFFYLAAHLCRCGRYFGGGFNLDTNLVREQKSWDFDRVDSRFARWTRLVKPNFSSFRNIDCNDFPVTS